MEAAPADATQPIRDYAALTHEVRRELAERIYNPAVLESPRWQSFFSRIERRLPAAEDDAEALMIFYVAAQALELSHFALLGERFGDVELSRGGAEAEQRPSAVQLRFPQAGLAHLVIRHFAGTPEPIERAFVEIHAVGAGTLILDLRGNTGATFLQ